MAKPKAPPGGRTVSMAGSARKGRSRLHRTVIEHGVKGGGKVTHERVRKDPSSYNGLRTEEQPPHMFGNNADLMAHLTSTLGGGSTTPVDEEAGEAVPDNEATEAAAPLQTKTRR